MDTGDFSSQQVEHAVRHVESRIFLASAIGDGFFPTDLRVEREVLSVTKLRHLLAESTVLVLDHVLADELDHLRQSLDLCIRNLIPMLADPKIVAGDLVIVIRSNSDSSFSAYRAASPLEIDPWVM